MKRYILPLFFLFIVGCKTTRPTTPPVIPIPEPEEEQCYIIESEPGMEIRIPIPCDRLEELENDSFEIGEETPPPYGCVEGRKRGVDC